MYIAIYQYKFETPLVCKFDTHEKALADIQRSKENGTRAQRATIYNIGGQFAIPIEMETIRFVA